MKSCDECGDDVKRRTCCEMCLKMVCGWCLHHIHNVHVRLTVGGYVPSSAKRDAMLSEHKPGKGRVVT
jgi:hypothetical protein